MSKSLVTIDKESIPAVFTKNGADEIIAELRKKAKEFIPDLSTGKSRAEIASNSAKFSTSKTFAEKCRTEYKADLAAQVKIIDAEGKKIRDVCDELRVEVRKPLTDWENEEKLRKEKEKLDKEISEAHDLAILENDLIDRQKAIEAKEAKIEKEAEDKRLKEEAEQNERDRIAREEQLKADAIAEEQRKHEEKLEAERLESAKREADAILAKETAEREAQEAIDREKAAEEKRIEDEKQAKIDQETAIKKAKQDAEEKAAEEAKQKESDRLAQELLLKRKAEKKAANVAHQRKINKAALVSLVKYGLSDEDGIKLITAIAKGEIDNISMDY